MKIYKTLIPIVSTFLLLTACHKEKHFITDSDYRAQVHEDFINRQAIASGRSDALFSGMDTLDIETREALEFLYAYMPYSDLADYDQSFYLQQIRSAFAARERFSWGKDVPEDIFRHFVLVYRVNNENLDTARLLMQRELAPRVEGLSMYEAALEVNHWCHEHVAYRASDGRTSATLATMRTSLGRCGEESTFAVTALRSVGIPARQCYTPRWAHCDDNHAWVEVYIADSNKWYFMGACEPDAELDMGWFAVPSTRCMMVHSKAFGRYHGNEEVVKQTALYSELNLLSHYAPTRKLTVCVTDTNSKAIEGIDVKFKLYNYSEFYTLATIKTNSQGQSQLTTGLGDLLIWVTNGKHYAYRKVDVRKDSIITIVLDTTEEIIHPLFTQVNDENPGCIDVFPNMLHLDIVPPIAGKTRVTPSKEKAEQNAKRLIFEDSVRGAYMATFPNKDNFKTIINTAQDGIPNLNDDQLWEIIQKSEGNYQEISNFISSNYLKERGFEHLYDYLKSYSDKDMRDITCDVLDAHFTSYETGSEALEYDIYKVGIMPARISNEMVRSWREYLTDELQQLAVSIDAATLKKWTIENIIVDDTGNYYNCPISPKGVYELRHSDKHSRDIFFIAACRSLCIPAYLDNATNNIYVWEQNKWTIVTFDEEQCKQPTATLTLTYSPTKDLSKPVYWSHFSIAKYENGDFVTFDFEDDSRMSKFPTTINLEPGYYCLTTGNRYPEGDVLVRSQYFAVEEGQKTTKQIILRPLIDRSDAVQAILNPNQTIIADMTTLADYAGETGMLFVFVGDYKEPSKHLIKEMQSLEKEFKAWGGAIYLVAPASANPVSWKLPNTDYLIRDSKSKDIFEKQIVAALKLDLKNDYPLVAVVNSKGEILFHSHGYSIGLAEQVLKKLKTIH